MTPVKVLVVDDEPDLELLVRQKFRRQIREKEYEFAFAHNGVEALDQLKADPQIDLVMTDINMPVMDGLTLLAKIAELSQIIKTVVVSAYGDMTNIRTAMNRGAFDFLTKPIDFDDLTITINKTAQHVKDLKASLEEREQLSAIQQELNVATRIQQAILPSEFPPFPNIEEFELFATMIPAQEVGGDFYDFFLLDEDRLGLAIGDVSGKGVPAAIFMAVTRTLLKSVAVAGVRTGDCLQRVNRLLTAENTSCMFVTLFYGVLNIRSGEFEYSNAGHNPPYLINTGGAERLPGPSGIVLGVNGSYKYPTETVMVAPGGRLFLYTDGITEAFNADGQMYTEERLQDCLRDLSGSSPQEIIDRVVAEVRDFSGQTPQSDDLTMLAASYLA